MDKFEGLSARDLRAMKRDKLRQLAEETAECEKWRRRHHRVQRFLEITRSLFAQRFGELRTTGKDADISSESESESE